ncbi:DUF2007 domain-containing protein [bacterium]|nr:DUF2007 domain-containing protein [bacterium]
MDDQMDPKERRGIKRAEGELLGSTEPEGELVRDVTWEPVARDLDPIQAQLLRDDLEDAGIPVVITGQSLESFNIYPNVENAILVPRRWLPEARIIADDFLARIEGGAGDVNICSACGAEVPEDASRCPSCGEAFES